MSSNMQTKSSFMDHMFITGTTFFTHRNLSHQLIGSRFMQVMAGSVDFVIEQVSNQEPSMGRKGLQMTLVQRHLLKNSIPF